MGPLCDPRRAFSGDEDVQAFVTAASSLLAASSGA